VDEGIYAELYAREEGHWWFRGRRAVIWSLLSDLSLPQPARVLDAGCGTGRNLVEFGRLGPAHGVDPSPVAVEFCHQRGLENVQQAGLEDLPFDDANFDLVLATDVIEHIERDDIALRELRRVVAPAGRLLITVPAYQWLWSHHDDTHHHFRRYTLPRLRTVVTGNGWHVERATYFNSVLLPPIAAARAFSKRNGGGDERADYDKTPAALNAVLELPMQAEARAIRRGARLPAGVSIGMVCRPN
jgi:SAM-dependent methyltransferase